MLVTFTVVIPDLVKDYHTYLVAANVRKFNISYYGPPIYMYNGDFLICTMSGKKWNHSVFASNFVKC